MADTKTYTVTHHLEGGKQLGYPKTDPVTRTVAEGGTDYPPLWYNIIKDGYALAGWNTAEDGSGTFYAYDADVTGVSSDMDLYAQWTTDCHVITFDPNGGSIPTMGWTEVSTDGTETPVTQEVSRIWVPNGANISLFELFSRLASSRDGYVLRGWNSVKDASGTWYWRASKGPGGILNSPMSSDVTLYAQWRPADAPENYTITLNSNYDGSTYTSTVNVAWGDPVNESLGSRFFSRSDDGYVIESWNTQPDGKGMRIECSDSVDYAAFPATSELTLYAQWVKTVSIWLNYNSDNGKFEQAKTAAYGVFSNGQVAHRSYVGKGTRIALPGPGVTMTAQPESWNTMPDGTGTSYSATDPVVIDSGIELFAIWADGERNCPIVTFDPNGGTSTARSLRVGVERYRGVLIPDTSPTRANEKSPVTLDFNARGGTDVDSITYDFDHSFSYYGWRKTAQTCDDDDDFTGKSWYGGYISASEFTADTTLYASWWRHVGDNGDATVDVPISTRDGYKFVKWATKEDGSGKDYHAQSNSRISYLPGNSMTLYAVWGRVCKLTYLPNGGKMYLRHHNGEEKVSYVQVDSRTSETGDDGYADLANGKYMVTHDGGYIFDSWNSEPDGTGEKYARVYDEDRDEYVNPHFEEDASLYAQYVEAWVLTVDPNGGTLEADDGDPRRANDFKCAKGGELDLFRVAEYVVPPDSKKFDSFNTKADGSGTRYTSQDDLSLTADTTLFAQYHDAFKTVTYKSNGDYGDDVTAKVEYGDGFDFENQLFSRDGYVIDSWNTKADGTGTKYDPGDYYREITEDLVVYAQWVEGIVVKFHVDGDGVSCWPSYDVTDGVVIRVYGLENGRASVKLLSGEDAPYDNLPRVEKSDCGLRGWNTKEDGTGTLYTVAPKDGIAYLRKSADFYPVWVADKTVTFEPNGADGDPITVVVRYNKTFDTPAANVYTREHFEKIGSWGEGTLSLDTGATILWSDYSWAADNAGSVLYSRLQDSYKAHWLGNKHAVTFNSNDDGLVNETVEVRYSENLAFPTDFTRDGYTLESWNTRGDGTGDTYSNPYMMDADQLLYAQWKIIECTATFYVDSDVQETLKADFGDLIAAPECGTNKDGMVFAGWCTSADGKGQDYAAGANIELESDLSLYAQWVDQYTITYDANGGASAPAAQKKAAGESVTITLEEPVWSTDSSDETIDYDGNGAEYSGSQTITATPTREFQGWNTAADGSGASVAAGTVYSTDASVILYAQWSEEEETDYGSAEVLPGPDRDGYDFEGWNTEQDGSGYWYQDDQEVSIGDDVYEGGDGDGDDLDDSAFDPDDTADVEPEDFTIFGDDDDDSEPDPESEYDDVPEDDDGSAIVDSAPAMAKAAPMMAPAKLVAKAKKSSKKRLYAQWTETKHGIDVFMRPTPSSSQHWWELHSLATSRRIKNGKIVQSNTEIDSFEFDVYPENACYKHFKRMATLVYAVNKDGHACEFYGRVIEIEPNMDEDGTLYKHVVCEGCKAFLRDSICRIDTANVLAKENIQKSGKHYLCFTDGSVRLSRQRLMGQLIEEHNKHHPTRYKKVTSQSIDCDGHCDVNPDIEQSTWDNIKSFAIDWGYEVKVRPAQFTSQTTRSGHSVRLPKLNSGLYVKIGERIGGDRGSIKLAVNMLSVARTSNASDVITRLYPYGDSYNFDSKIDDDNTKWTHNYWMGLNMYREKYPSLFKSVMNDVLGGDWSASDVDNGNNTGYITRDSARKRFGIIEKAIVIDGLVDTDDAISDYNEKHKKADKKKKIEKDKVDSNKKAVKVVKEKISEKDAEKLFRYAARYLKKMSKASISVDVKAVDLAVLGLNFNAYHVYDWWDIKNSKLGVNDNLEIVKRTVDLDNLEQCSIEFGEKKPKVSDFSHKTRQRVEKNNRETKTKDRKRPREKGSGDGWKHEVVDEVPKKMEEDTIYFVRQHQ